MNQEFLSFLKDKEPVPSQLYRDTKEVILICLNPSYTIAKFYLLQIVGMFLSLIICPQYGFYPVYFGHLTEFLFLLNPIACAFLCSTIFFGAGLALNFYFLKRAEALWLSRHKIALILPFNTIVFFMMMMTKKFTVDSHITHNGPAFDLTWFLSSMLVGTTFYFLLRLKLSTTNLLVSKRF